MTITRALRTPSKFDPTDLAVRNTATGITALASGAFPTPLSTRIDAAFLVVAEVIAGTVNMTSYADHQPGREAGYQHQNGFPHDDSPAAIQSLSGIDGSRVRCPRQEQCSRFRFGIEFSVLHSETRGVHHCRNVPTPATCLKEQ